MPGSRCEGPPRTSAKRVREGLLYLTAPTPETASLLSALRAVEDRRSADVSRFVRSRAGFLERYGDAGEQAASRSVSAGGMPRSMCGRMASTRCCAERSALVPLLVQVCLKHAAVCWGRCSAGKPGAFESGHDPDHRLGCHERQPRQLGAGGPGVADLVSCAPLTSQAGYPPRFGREAAGRRGPASPFVVDAVGDLTREIRRYVR